LEQSLTNHKPKILVLDEDLLALELYSRELSMDYEVLISADAHESLHSLSSYQPDVLVIEPATNNNAGWEVLMSIAALENPPNVILCSTQDDRPQQPCPSIDRYLVKPVLPVTLHTLVDQIMAKRLHHLHQRLDQD
jgi:response regulator RpfG family c-di-GMP phosphodiesterase